MTALVRDLSNTAKLMDTGYCQPIKQNCLKWMGGDKGKESGTGSEEHLRKESEPFHQYSTDPHLQQ